MRKMMMSMCSACLMAAAHADEKTVEMRTVNANGLSESIATVTVLTMPWGVLFTSDLSDLPGLYVDAEGNAKHLVLASRLKLSDLNGPALMIHAGGNVYSDKPVELGAADRASFAALSSRSGTARLGHI